MTGGSLARLRGGSTPAVVVACERRRDGRATGRPAAAGQRGGGDAARTPTGRAGRRRKSVRAAAGPGHERRGRPLAVPRRASRGRPAVPRRAAGGRSFAPRPQLAAQRALPGRRRATRPRGGGAAAPTAPPPDVPRLLRPAGPSRRHRPTSRTVPLRRPRSGGLTQGSPPTVARRLKPNPFGHGGPAPATHPPSDAMPSARSTRFDGQRGPWRARSSGRPRRGGPPETSRSRGAGERGAIEAGTSGAYYQAASDRGTVHRRKTPPTTAQRVDRYHPDRGPSVRRYLLPLRPARDEPEQPGAGGRGTTADRAASPWPRTQGRGQAEEHGRPRIAPREADNQPTAERPPSAKGTSPSANRGPERRIGVPRLPARRPRPYTLSGAATANPPSALARPTGDQTRAAPAPTNLGRTSTVATTSTQLPTRRKPATAPVRP